MSQFAIKVRMPGKKAWAFLSSNGGLNRLKIHAVRFYERETAQTVIDTSKASNPGVDWKIVAL